MKSTKTLNKRSFSPLIPKNIDISDRKKKSTSNYPSNPYRPSKDIETQGKSDKKRQTNYLKDIIKQSDSANKYRIVTEPVDDRVMTIISSSFVPNRSKGKFEMDNQRKIRQVSQQKRCVQSVCPNCQRYTEELNYMKSQLNHIFTTKILWKDGDISLPDIRSQFGLTNSPKTSSKKNANSFKYLDTILNQTKKHFYDLMKDIESLTEIDYPKMLALKIFKYDPMIQTPNVNKNSEEGEIKSLLSQLRNHYEGKINSWDIEDESEESDHIKAILRNLKSRLGHSLRQNLELKTKKAILEKAEEMSAQSQQYLRHIVEDVLNSYSGKI